MARPMSLPLSAKSAADVNHVYAGGASYYNPVTKKWQNGTLTLHRRCIEFSAEDEDINTPFHLTIPLRSVSGIKKRSSLFIYAALVIEVGCEAHWFSSFSNRDSVFNLLELFWRDALMSKSLPSSSCVNDLNAKTGLGKQLLSMLRESEDTLVTTASELEEQGRQLHEAQEAINDLNADLNTAEKFLSSGQTVAGCSSQEMNQTIQTAKKIINIKKKKYKVTFVHDTGNEDSSSLTWEKGFMIFDGSFQFLDEQENFRFNIPHDEVQELKVVTPWELHITQINENGNTLLYRVICPMLVQLHKILSSSQDFHDKVTYEDEAHFPFRKKCDSASSSSSTSLASSTSSASSSTTSLSPDIPLIIQQVQKVQSSGSLLQEEAQEISTVLENLQTLASEVNKEQECQMEKINQLIDDVNKTELRINCDNKTLRKMI